MVSFLLNLNFDFYNDLNNATYHVKISTGSLPGSGTTSHVFMQILRRDKNAKCMKFEPTVSKSHFFKEKT